MELVELNPEGNFNSWEDSKLEEIKHANYSTDIGDCLFENSEIKVWQIHLKPSQRMPFRAHYNNYSCSSLTNALLLMRNINGQINMLRMNKGEHFFWEFEDNGCTIHDIENIGENVVKIAVIEQVL
jgi:hypothetical protein